MLVTKHAIDYKAAPYGRIIIIPAGVPVLPATNLPARGEDPQYWVQEWEDMPNSAHSWLRNYGFLVDASDVEEIDEPITPITPSYAEMDFCPRCQQVHAGGCKENFNRQFEEWNGNSDGSVAVD